MFYYLSDLAALKDEWAGWSLFNVFRYITFRALMATITSLVICWLMGPYVIRVLTALKIGQPIRTATEVRQLSELHGKKTGTPTMGGALVILAVLVSSLLWAQPTNLYVWLTLGTVVAMGALGFVDDYKKVVQKSSKGIRPREKMLAQLLVAVAVGVALWWEADAASLKRELYLPFYKKPILASMGVLMLPFAWLVLSGTSNAVNLTDGLDGLATGCTVTVAAVFSILAYVGGHNIYAAYLHIPHIAKASELAVVCAALLGASLGFLWYNCHPAKVFMGDTGSLAIGGLLGVVALCTKNEFLLVIVGGIFVIEAVSVILQVASFKLTGKRIFAMAPLHHHFELKGWSETTVVVRFWILSLLFALLGLVSLKLR